MIDGSTLIQLRLDYCQQLLDDEKHHEALLELEEILDQQVDCIEAIYLTGQAYLLMRNAPVAEDCFRQIQRLTFLEDQQAELHLSLALSLFFQYNFIDALNEIKNSLKYDNNQALVWRYKSIIEERLGYKKMSVHSCKTAHKIQQDGYSIPDWEIEQHLPVIMDKVAQAIDGSGICKVNWVEFPDSTQAIDRNSISPQQVMHCDPRNMEITIFYGNLKYVASDTDSQFAFLQMELQNIIPTLL